MHLWIIATHPTKQKIWNLKKMHQFKFQKYFGLLFIMGKSAPSRLKKKNIWPCQFFSRKNHIMYSARQVHFRVERSFCMHTWPQYSLRLALWLVGSAARRAQISALNTSTTLNLIYLCNPTHIYNMRVCIQNWTAQFVCSHRTCI